MVVVGIEQDEVAGEVRIHQLEGERCSQSRKERSPHDFVREIVGDLWTQREMGETANAISQASCL